MRSIPLLFALLLVTVPAQAASPAPASPDSVPPPPTSLTHALDLIRPASGVRVEADPHRLLEGALGRRDVNTLWLTAAAGEAEIPLSSVRTMWVRGRATRHGAKVGAITLFIVGAITGPVSVGLDRIREGGSSQAPDAGDYLGAAAIGAAAGVVAGALLGAGVGAAFHRWNQKFP